MSSTGTRFYGQLIGNGAGCQRVNVNGYEVSMAFDTSLKKDGVLRRFDIRVFDKLGNDITCKVFNCDKHDVVEGTLENFERAVNWCRTH